MYFLSLECAEDVLDTLLGVAEEHHLGIVPGEQRVLKSGVARGR